MQIETKLLSGALGAEIKGIDLTDISDENFKRINDLLLEHKVIFFRNQPLTAEQHIALAEIFCPLETHAYVKGLEKYPEIVRIIKAEDEKNQWGENWHSDVSYNVKPTKAVIIKSIKIPPVGGDTCFSNMELAWETLDEKIKEQVKKIEQAGVGRFPVCIAKTQYSFSTDPKLKGAPSGHTLPIREIRLSSGAGFVVVICGSIMTMPGLPRVPAADSIKLNKKGDIEGLF